MPLYKEVVLYVPDGLHLPEGVIENVILATKRKSASIIVFNFSLPFTLLAKAKLVSKNLHTLYHSRFPRHSHEGGNPAGFHHRGNNNLCLYYGKIKEWHSIHRSYL